MSYIKALLTNLDPALRIWLLQVPHSHAVIFFSKIKEYVVVDTWIKEMFLEIMEINVFWGDLTDVWAKQKYCRSIRTCTSRAAGTGLAATGSYSPGRLTQHGERFQSYVRPLSFQEELMYLNRSSIQI